MKFIVLFLSAMAAFGQGSLPRFEDYPVTADWTGHSVVLNFANRSQRRFRTHLLEATNQPPNFAGHYRWTVWGCGSNCMSGAIADLATGKIITPPLAEDNDARMSFVACPSAFDGAGVDIRLDSRLMIVHCGLNYDTHLDQNVPDVYYFVLEHQAFRQLVHLHGKDARRLSN